MPADEDHRRRHERHQLPAGEERERVARAEDEREDEQEDAGEPAVTRPPRVRREVARGEDERRRADQPEHDEEEAAQRIDAEARLEARS